MMKNALFVAVSLAAFSVVGSAHAETVAVKAQTEEAVAASAGSVQINPGKMLYSADGSRLAAVNRVNGAGDAQVILNGRLVTVPLGTLSDNGGKLTTSLSKRDLSR